MVDTSTGSRKVLAAQLLVPCTEHPARYVPGNRNPALTVGSTALPLRSSTSYWHEPCCPPFPGDPEMVAVRARADTALSKRHAVLLLRWVLIIATSYLVVFSRPLAKNPVSAALFVAAYFATNIALTHIMPRLRSQYVFDMCVVVLDIAM